MTSLTAPPRTFRLAQGLSALLAVPMIFGSVYFGVVHPDESYARWVTWATAPIAFVVGIGLLTATIAGLRPNPRAYRAAIFLLTAAEAFNVMKIAVFGESAAVSFLVVATLTLGLLLSPSVRRHFAS
jgi:hypothetical protein